MSWMESLGKNLIKNVEVTIGDNKTIAEMVDGNLKVEHYYKNEIVIEKPVRIGVNTISQTTNSNRDRSLRSTPPIPKNIVSPWTQPWRYNMDKQTYTERELVKNLELIGNHPECIIEKYDTCNWTDSTYETVIDIADYIYEDYIKGGQDGLCYFSFIYNNIIVFIENDSEISNPSIKFKYVKSQIDICDLNKIKKTFNFLSEEMSKD
jgi:hypothetical protein